jgi:hypothetical protein
LGNNVVKKKVVVIKLAEQDAQRVTCIIKSWVDRHGLLIPTRWGLKIARLDAPVKFLEYCFIGNRLDNNGKGNGQVGEGEKVQEPVQRVGMNVFFSCQSSRC